MAEDEEVERVVPVIEGIRKASDRLWVSVDTRRAKGESIPAATFLRFAVAWCSHV